MHYYNKLKESQHNMKQTWNIINELIKRTRDKKDVSYILHDNIEYTDPFSIAQQFNNYFSTVGLKQAQYIATKQQNPPNPLPAQPQNIASIFLTPTNADEILHIISSLKSKPSSGYDYISTHHIKQIAHILSYPLTTLLNRSLSQGYFPTELKTAKIIPIHKKRRNTSTK